MGPHRLFPNHDEHEGRPDLVRARFRMRIVEGVWRVFWSSMLILIASLIVWDIVVSHQSRDTILDCTTPGGECYKQSQERSAVIVKQLTDLSSEAAVAAAFCADRPGDQTVQQIQRCTLRIMQLEEE